MTLRTVQPILRFGLPSWQSPGAQAPPDYDFRTQDGDLNQRTATVVHGPADPALLGDYGEGAIRLVGAVWVVSVAE